MHLREEFAIEEPGRGIRIGSVSFDANWRAWQPAEREFVVTATDSRCDLLAMLIERHDGVAYRVQMAGAPILERDWWAGKPQWKMTILG